MKTLNLFKEAIVPLLAITLIISCSKNSDDGNGSQQRSIFGSYELVSGTFIQDNFKYFYINEDNTLNLLGEDELGFRSELASNITVSETQLTANIQYYGNLILNYTLSEETLELNLAGEPPIILRKIANAPNAQDWIQELTIESEGTLAWEEDADIAWNGSRILLGNGYEADNIGVINPNTFTMESEIITTRSAFAVEVEKNSSVDKLIFQSDNGSTKFFAYREDTNALVLESMAMGAWIQGLASVNSEKIWASSGNEDQLYLYNYNTNITEKTIDVDFQPKGLDYQEGFLYVSDGQKLHKCETAPTLRCIASYQIPNHQINGIAYDGSNFWVSARNSSGYKLIKTNLSL